MPRRLVGSQVSVGGSACPPDAAAKRPSVKNRPRASTRADGSEIGPQRISAAERSEARVHSPSPPLKKRENKRRTAQEGLPHHNASGAPPRLLVVSIERPQHYFSLPTTFRAVLPNDRHFPPLPLHAARREQARAETAVPPVKTQPRVGRVESPRGSAGSESPVTDAVLCAALERITREIERDESGECRRNGVARHITSFGRGHFHYEAVEREGFIFTTREKTTHVVHACQNELALVKCSKDGHSLQFYLDDMNATSSVISRSLSPVPISQTGLPIENIRKWLKC
ncbi:hypothetical protein C8F04DRAFT_1237764 [Mycena alexandri]|uniref:Uncharacterized protein n=1 Tax=Mycena alexandri TaxID=1745969 RepID=A0AAD6SIH1_9AGAR|nr:hypothetical protein C8F04DRAFT_1237764 [Mycena alexandri]